MLSGECGSVGSAVYGHAAYIKKIAESFKLSVYLHGKFTGGSHDYTVDGILGKLTVGKTVEYGQQICCRLAGACLCHGYEIVAFKGYWYGLLLYRGALVEAHGIECVKYIVVQVKFIKLHNEDNNNVG